MKKKYSFLLSILFLVLIIAVLLVPTFRIGAEYEPKPRTLAPTVDAPRVLDHLAGGLRIATVSYQDREKIDRSAFTRFLAYLEATYPRLHEALQVETVHRFSRLYRWPGTDPDRAPLVLTAHLDVVPVEPGSETQWTHPPFSGTIADGFVWGRGALDDKASLFAILDAVDLLLKRGFRPRRPVYLAFGHDEEIGGKQGALQIVKKLQSQGVQPFMVLDEGMAVLESFRPLGARPVALVGIAEKGYATLELTVETTGGHSSMPPPHTAIGVLSAALARLEEHPLPASLGGPVRQMFIALAPYMPFPRRLVFANLWLFAPLIRSVMERDPAGQAFVRTTTAITVIRGGTKENVLPRRARALVNFRIRPGETFDDVVRHVRDVVQDEQVQVRILPDDAHDPSPVSPIDRPAYRLLRDAIRATLPGVDVVAPGLVVGATDARHYAVLTRYIYRFAPLRLAPNDVTRIHGVDERISIPVYIDMVRFYADLIQRVAGAVIRSDDAPGRL